MTMIEKLKQYYEEGNVDRVEEIIIFDEIEGINDEFVGYLSKYGKRPEDWDYDDMHDFVKSYLKKKKFEEEKETDGVLLCGDNGIIYAFRSLEACKSLVERMAKYPIAQDWLYVYSADHYIKSLQWACEDFDKPDMGEMIAVWNPIDHKWCDAV